MGIIRDIAKSKINGICSQMFSKQSLYSYKLSAYFMHKFF